MNLYKKITKSNEKEIDKELLPLIKELNKVGLKTKACCSGHGKEDAYIAIDIKGINMIIQENSSLSIYWKLK